MNTVVKVFFFKKDPAMLKLQSGQLSQQHNILQTHCSNSAGHCCSSQPVYLHGYQLWELSFFLFNELLILENHSRQKIHTWTGWLHWPDVLFYSTSETMQCMRCCQPLQTGQIDVALGTDPTATPGRSPEGLTHSSQWQSPEITTWG